MHLPKAKDVQFDIDPYLNEVLPAPRLHRLRRLVAHCFGHHGLVGCCRTSDHSSGMVLHTNRIARLHHHAFICVVAQKPSATTPSILVDSRETREIVVADMETDIQGSERRYRCFRTEDAPSVDQQKVWQSEPLERKRWRPREEERF